MASKPLLLCLLLSLGTFGTIFNQVSDIEVPDFCHLPAYTGRCRAAFPRFFYDVETFECKSFIYGGCNSNGNNFMDKETCERTCKREVCDRPKYSGMCQAYMPRYYYDIDSQTCRQFIYGGCQSNGNNFQDRYICESVCAGVNRDDPNDPEEGRSGAQRALDRAREGDDRIDLDRQPDPVDDDDVENNQGNRGKQGLRDQDELSKEQIRDRDDEDNNAISVGAEAAEVPVYCFLPKFVGPCRARILRYYYDESKRACLTFNYGGCLTNGNNFNTKDDCERTCKRDFDNQQNDNEDNDNSNDPNPSNEKYENSNHEHEGQRSNAIPKRFPPCMLPPAIGPCKAYFERWYYDLKSGDCQTFIYGGCQSNGNNFKTKEECQFICKDQSASARKKRFNN